MATDQQLNDFFAKWDECLIGKLHTHFEELGNSTLFEAFTMLTTNEAWQAAMGALSEALLGVDDPIISLLTLELQFFCEYDGSTGSASPTTNHAILEKAKIILNSIMFLLDNLEFKHKKLLHIPVKLIGLAQ